MNILILMGTLGLRQRDFLSHLQKFVSKLIILRNPIAIENNLYSCVGEINIMFEKLILAIAITFSLNLFFHIREPSRNNTHITVQKQPNSATPTILVKNFGNRD
jgi:hypothetical protein